MICRDKGPLLVQNMVPSRKIVSLLGACNGPHDPTPALLFALACECAVEVLGENGWVQCLPGKVYLQFLPLNLAAGLSAAKRLEIGFACCDSQPVSHSL
jgi:hypothetical protein